MPVASDKLNINFSDGAIMPDANFRILAGILSSAVDLLACRLRSVMDTFSILISRKQNDEFVIEIERLQLFDEPFSSNSLLASDASLGPILTK